MTNTGTNIHFEKQKLWFVLIPYLILLGVSLFLHELWGDEVHSWNLAKGSQTLSDLFANIRYEGHPPLWYLLLYSLTKITHQPNAMQFLQFAICGLTAYIFLFKTKLRLSYKILILFGYYFLYEYAALSRNYTIGILIAFTICILMDSTTKFKNVYYLTLLFILSNTHFLSLILAISLHGYYFLYLKNEILSLSKRLVYFFLGLIVLVPAFYFIWPPTNSNLNTDFWMRIWSKDQIFISVQAPLKAFCPIPAWWEYHFWNTQFLVLIQKTVFIFKYINPFLSLFFISLSIYLLYPNKKVVYFFLTNSILTLLFALIFPLVTARYVGFIFIGFVIALILTKDTIQLSKLKHILINGLLALQLIGSIIALSKDWRYPFSHINEVKTICERVPKGKEIITDYWCLNYLSAAMDKPFYCLGFNQEKLFLLWDMEMKAVSEQKNSYSQGAQIYFQTHATEAVYFITNTSNNDLIQRDSLFFTYFKVELMNGQTDAIERYSNINLYKVSKRPKDDE